MEVGKKISPAVIRRLPRYYRYLSDLLDQNITKISSTRLSAKMGITASQIRQDLNCFGGFGQQGYGYNVRSLYNEIATILGVDKGFSAILIGAGNMGQALANYTNFEKRGYRLIGIFDINPSIIGTRIKDLDVFSIEYVEDFVKKNKVDIAMLCIPFEKTPDIAERIAKLGVKGLWNFSPTDLSLPYDVIIENVHLSDSLMVLGYHINSVRE